MSDKTKSDDVHLKLYSLLVDQLHKYTSVLWQFPTALIVANFFALDKFLAQPRILVVLAVLDGVLVFVFARLVHHQKAIIAASTKAEEVLREELRDTKYQPFIPTFTDSCPKASNVTIWSLSLLTLFLLSYAVPKAFCPLNGDSVNPEYKSITIAGTSIDQELNREATNDWKLVAIVQNQTVSNQFILILNRTKR